MLLFVVIKTARLCAQGIGIGLALRSLTWLGFFGLALLAAQMPQPVVKLAQPRSLAQAYTGCTLVISPDKVVQNATLLVREGRVEAAGEASAVNIPPDAVVRRLPGLWIYPGFLDAFSEYGLKPVARGEQPRTPQYEAKRKGPYHWNDAVNTHLCAADLVAHNEGQAQALRALGFTALNVAHNDGILRGSGVLLQLCSDPAKAVLREQSCMGGSFSRGASTQAYPESQMGAMALIRQALADADWYEEAQELYARNPLQPPVQANRSLEALIEARGKQLPFIFQAGSYLQTLRAHSLAREAGMNWAYKTPGDEYKAMNDIAAMGAYIIASLDYPPALAADQPADMHEISLARLKAWGNAPGNLAALARAKVKHCITPHGLADTNNFWERLRLALRYGYTEQEALRALTQTPAALLGVEAQVGTLEKGKMANFFIATGNVFADKAEIIETHVGGEGFTHRFLPDIDLRGQYVLTFVGQRFDLYIAGSRTAPEATVGTLKAAFSISGAQFSLTFPTPGGDTVRMNGYAEPQFLEGYGLQNGIRAPFRAERQPMAVNIVQQTPPAPAPVAVPITYPNGAFGWDTLPTQARPTLIRNATVWTCAAAGILPGTDVLLEGGKIRQVGPGIAPPRDALIVDGTGMHLTPGLIDEHSHIAVEGGVNEGTHSVSAEVRIADVLRPDDINIYRQLAGGVTAAQLLHGSSNPIGGQSAIIKLRWGQPAQRLLMAEAPPFIKFALGENVKQSNWGDAFSSRYPQTRMGVEQSIREAFRRAKEYTAKTDGYDRKDRRAGFAPPQPNFQLEAVAEILAGKRHITCHSYVQSEILMLMRLAEAEGFKINTFTHVLEGYKVAQALRQHGATASTFSDWWGYKFEVMDGIPQNAAMMTRAGVNVCINSDDAEMGRRLNHEAAKSVKYGGMAEAEALKMITLNPAKALHIDAHVGSIEAGKQADVVLWTAPPLSVYARVQQTYIDGIPYFDAARDARMRTRLAQDRALLLAAMRAAKGPKAPAAEAPAGERHYHCDSREAW